MSTTTESVQLTKEFCQEWTRKILEELRAVTGDERWSNNERYNLHQWAGALKHDSGYGLFLDFNTQRGKVRVSSLTTNEWATHPDFRYEVQEPASIGIGLTKGANAIAKSIVSRYLKALQESHARNSEAFEAYKKRKADRRQQLQELSEILGDAGYLHGSPGHETLRLYEKSITSRGTIKVEDDGTIEMDLHNIPFEITKQILQLIKGR